MKPDVVVKGIAAIQVFGAAAAAFQIIDSVPEYQWNILSTVALVYFVAFAVIAFFAGMRLWAGEPGGFRWTIVALAIQIPMISTNLLIYNIMPTYGMVFGILFPPIDVGVVFYASPSISIFVLNQLESSHVTANVIPTLCLWYLVRLRAAHVMRTEVTPEI